MFKSVEIIIPAKTARIDHQETTVGLCKGILERITIRPAYGPNWEIFCQIRYREFALAPREFDEWIPLERYPVDVFLNFDKWDGTYDIQVFTCSPDARFSHRLQIDITVNEKPSLVDLLYSFLRRGM